MSEGLDPRYSLIAQVAGLRFVVTTMLMGAFATTKEPEKQAATLRNTIAQSVDNQQLTEFPEAQREPYREAMKDAAVRVIDAAERAVVQARQPEQAS